MKSPRLLKKARHLLKKKKNHYLLISNTCQNPTSLHRLVIYGRVQLEKQQDDSHYHMTRNQSVSNLFHVRSLSLPPEHPRSGKNNPVLAKPHQEEEPADESRRASLQPVPPQVKAARRAGGNIPKPTDARTEKGGHDAERKDLTLWSRKPWRRRGVHLSPRVWGIFLMTRVTMAGRP